MDFFRIKKPKPNLKSFERPETLPGPYGIQTEAILAFRTITTILSMIQSPEIANTEPKTLTIPQRKELRVLDSLASLANRQHEIVAATTALPAQSSSGDCGAKIQVMLSIADPIDSELALTSPQKTWFQWALSMNARRDPPKFPPTRQDEMEIKDPNTSISLTLKKLMSEEPSKVSNQKLLHSYLLTEWRVFHGFLLPKLICHAHRGKETFETHIWMLKTLLARSQCDLDTLQHFSIAASFLKMLSRMDNRFVSQPFRSHLDSLKGKIMYQAQTVSGSNSGRKHDETFLLFVIPNLVTFVKAKIPNLQAMAAAAAADKNKNKDIKIYNEDTCTEYHDLLCELL